MVSDLSTGAYMKVFYKFLSLILNFFSNTLLASIEIIQLNQRFTLIKVEAKNVKATLLKPVDGLSLYSVETINLPIKFDFISRRANPYDEALYVTLKTRDIIKKSKIIYILGTSLLKDDNNRYFTTWEYTSGEGGCITYFTEDKCPGYYKDELDSWKDKPIDYKMFPELFQGSPANSITPIKTKTNQNLAQ